MDVRGLLRFHPRLRIPFRHKNKKQQQTPSLDMERPPSYDECSVFFYAPPSYEEIVLEASSSTRERRHSVNRMSWGSDTSSSGLSSVVTTASTSSHSPLVPTAPPLSPLSSSFDTSSTLSLWLSAVSSSNSRNHENMSRMGHRTPSSDSIVSNSSASTPDVITRTRPRMCSWTQCVRWVVQYTLESNFRSTMAHFHCLVKKAIRISQQHEAYSEMYPICLSSLAVPKPTALSLRTWTEFILSMGFKFSQTNNININNNNNNNNNDNGDFHRSYESMLASVLANENNNNGNLGSSETGDLCVIVPRDLRPSQLIKYRNVLTGLLELPHSAIKTAANMSRTETERMIDLLTPLIRSSYHALSVNHDLVRPLWDIHRRPGFFLMSLDFTEFRSEGGKFLKVPEGEVARRRIHLAKEILEMFLRN